MLTGPTGKVVLDSDAGTSDPSLTIVTGGSVAGPAAEPTNGSGEASAGPASPGDWKTGAGSAEAGERLRERVQSAVGTDYRLIELVGRGGMGIVLRAIETALDREVALKVLALDPLLAPEAYERFEREAKLAARLDHPNIVPIFSVGRRDSVAFYTMRLVRGGNVEDMLEARPRFEYDHATAILRDVAAALDYAHGRGVVHRDIKPANILIGESGHAMVADFGIAKALGSTTANATGTGIIGSPGYMSPEQWKGDLVDGRADQYALAVVAFEMLAGRRPFESPNMQELLQKHMSGEIPSVSTYRFGLHEGVDAAVRRALGKNADERFSSVSAFVEALSGLRSAAATMRSVRVPRYEPPPKRRRWPAIAALALMLVLSAAGATFAVPQTRPQALHFARIARAQAETLVADVRHAVIPPSLEVSADIIAGAAGDPAGADGDGEAIARDTGSDLRLPIVPDGEQLTSVGMMGVERTPLTLDPQTYGDQGSPFRDAAPVRAHGWVRVVLQGGVAPIIVNGRTIDASAGPAGQFVRLDVGQHFIAVRGAGVIFAPSQHTVEIAEHDTATVIFSVPGAVQATEPTPLPEATSVAPVPAPAPPTAADSSRPAPVTAGDSVRRAPEPADSVRPVPPADSTRQPPPR
ncbi:MAG TPA: serine/threonine-protein kinase [Gemmatimonadaceae bacterium]|nr:serine/threonine-protein kinase [Gemmatimonadaceae bacterium]